MKAFKISALVAIAALMSGCHENSSSAPNPDPSIPLVPIEPLPVQPTVEADTNIHFITTSTYPRSVMMGIMSAASSDENDNFEFWTSNDMGEAVQLNDNVFYKGRLVHTDEGAITPPNPGEPDPDGSSREFVQDGVQQELEDISDIVMDVEEGRMVNLFIDETYVRRSTAMMKTEAFSRIKAINIILEGAGTIMDNDRLSEVIELAQQAYDNGVEFRISMFSAVNLDVLRQDRELWDQLLKVDGVKVMPVSFEELNKELDEGYESEVFKNLMDFFGYDLETAFVKSANYDDNKKLLVYFGSARNAYGGNTQMNRKGGDYNNMVMVDHYLDDPELSSEYNFAMKPHPKTAWVVEKYIPKERPDASYFSSMPFEMLVLAAGKDFGLEERIPVIDRVDSTYSTILFSVDKSKIHSVIDYSKVENMRAPNDTVKYMRQNYKLIPGWGFDGDEDGDGIKESESYEDFAIKLRKQMDAPHIYVTNVYCFTRDCPGGEGHENH